MNTKMLGCACVAAAMGLGQAGTTAAETVVQVRDFNFLLEREGNAVPANAGYYYGGASSYLGDQPLSFDPFNTALGDLVQVQLDLTMAINGVIEIEPDVRVPSGDDFAALQVYDDLEITISGEGAAGNPEGFFLLAEADFGDYVVGEDGVVIDQTLLVDTSGEGSDATTNAADFSAFIDLVPVPAEVWAELVLDYSDTTLLGAPRGLTASGNLTLTYTYDDDFEGVVVPTPAALPAGMVMLAGLWLWHRRKA